MQTSYIIAGLLSFFAGVLITAIDYTYFDNIFVLCLLLIGLLVLEINIRNENIKGFFISESKSIKFELNKIEKICGISILSLMVSPFVYMLFISAFG